MASIDTSMYPTQPSQSNPLATVENYAGIQNTLAQNKLLQNKLSLFPLEQQNLQQTVQGQQSQNQIYAAQSQMEQLHSAQAQAAQHASILMGALQSGDLSDENMNNTAADLVTAGNAPQRIAQEMSSMPPASDPDSRSQFLQAHVQNQQQNISNAENAKAQIRAALGQAGLGSSTLPTSEYRDLGDSIQPYDNNILSGSYGKPLAPAIPKNMTPSEKATRQETMGPGGVAGTVPNSSLVDSRGYALPQGGGGGSQGMPAGSTPGNGAANPQGAAPGAQQGQGAPPGFNPTSLPIGDPQALQAAGTAAGTDLGADRRLANNGSTTLYNMQQAMTALKNSSTGPGQENANHIKNFLIAMDPSGTAQATFGSGPVNYDMANKYLTNQAQTLAANIGTKTDQQLATALTGSPNVHINNLAAQDVQKTVMGLTRMQIAKTQAFDQSGQPASAYDKWGANYNQTVDPTAFMVDQMKPSQLNSYTKGLSEPQMQKFEAGLRAAKAIGVQMVPAQ